MSVSRQKESYGSHIGIPLKKRRFYRPPSPPPETQVPLVKPDPLVNEESNLKLESAPSSDGNPKEIFGASSSLQERNQEHSPDRNVNLVQGNSPDRNVNLVQGNSPNRNVNLIQGNVKPEVAPSNAGNPKEVSGVVSSSQVKGRELLAVGNVNLVQGNVEPESAPSDAGKSMAVSTLASFPKENNQKHSSPRNIKLVQGNVASPRVSHQEPMGAESSDLGSEMNSKGKLLLQDKTDLMATAGNTDTVLLLAPNQALPHPGNTELLLTPNPALPRPGHSELQLASRQALQRQVKQELRNESEVLRLDTNCRSMELVHTELLLAEKKCLVPVVASQGNNEICEEKLDPCSWNLALTGAESSNQSDVNNAKSKIDSSNLSTNRSHWDLNTMMDTWDGSVSNSAVFSGVGDGDTQEAGGKREEPVICSTKIGRPDNTIVASGKQVLEKSEERTKLSTLSETLDPTQKTGDPLYLRLSTCNMNIPVKATLPSSSLALVASGIVKSEPSDVNRQEPKGKKVCSGKLVEHRTVKSEPLDSSLQESRKSPNIGNLKSVEHGNIKVEPLCRVEKQTTRRTEGNTGQQIKFNTSNPEKPIGSGVVPNLDGTTCTMPLQIIPPSLKVPTISEPPNGVDAQKRFEILPCNMDLTLSRDLVQNVEEVSTVTLVPVSEFLVPTRDESKDIHDIPCTTGLQGSDVADANESKDADDIPSTAKVEGSDVTIFPKSTAKLNLVSSGSVLVAESDEEKLNIFDDLQDDCSSDTDDEPEDPDGTPAVGGIIYSKGKQCDGEDDDYEDGEVRESSLHGVTEAGGYQDAAEHVDGGGESDMDISDEENVPCPDGDQGITLSTAETKYAKMEDPGETSCVSGECDNTLLNDNHSSAVCLQEPLKVEMLTTEDGSTVSEKKLASDGALGTSQETLSTGYHKIESQSELVQEFNPHQTAVCPALSNSEPLVNSAGVTKDVNSVGNRSRIINLARAFNEPSLSRTRSIPGRSLPSRIEGERPTDVGFSGDKLQYRGSRDERSMGRGYKFGRQRNHDQPGGNMGSEFMHGRGKTDRQMDFSRGDWDSNRNFAADDFSCSTQFRYNRPKNSSKPMVARDVTLVSAGRKQLSDEFRHQPVRRRSPAAREGAVSHGVQMVRRPQRNISPDRCIGGDGPSLIGLRREEKFIRGLPDDMIEHVFSRPPPRYQQLDNPFRRGDGSFSPIQRRGPIRISRIRSKSPGTRSRSPGPWSPPRRSPGEFGHPEMIHRRSPPFYRMERVRSPRQRPCFAEDVGGRRQVSPPYISRISSDMREMDNVRENDHQRSFIPNRSPSGRILPRGTRRFNMIDPRERIENGEYFAGPLHTGRFHELEGDEGAGERRICGERRGPVRSFRPPFDAATEVDNFQFDVEAAPRPFRFPPDEDAEFHERSNLREREFERRVKSRPGNVPRRNRSMEGEEENYRKGEQGWHGNSFDDATPVKRRRF